MIGGYIFAALCWLASIIYAWRAGYLAGQSDERYRLSILIREAKNGSYDEASYLKEDPILQNEDE